MGGQLCVWVKCESGGQVCVGDKCLQGPNVWGQVSRMFGLPY